MQRVIRFSKRLYDLQAIQQALEEFRDYLRGTVASRGKHFEVKLELHDTSEPEAGELLGEFMNYVLGASKSSRS